MPFDRQIKFHEPGQRRFEGGRVPAGRLLGQFLSPKRLQLHRPDQVCRPRARVQVVADGDQLTQPAVNLRNQQRNGRAGGEQPIRQSGRFRRHALHRVRRGTPKSSRGLPR